jgi:hypothetical protein
VNADRHRHAAAVNAAQFFGHDHGIGKIEAQPAVVGVVLDAEQAEIAEFLEHLVGRKLLGLFPAVDVGIEFGLDEFRDGLAKLLMLGRELHVRSSLSPGADAKSR